MSKIIDITPIKKMILEEHNQFLETFGQQLDKVVADHKLLAALAITKLQYVLCMFSDVIEKLEEIDYDPPCRCLKIYNDNNENYIHIVTNGVVVILTGSSYLSPSGINVSPKITFDGICSDDFDWYDFSKQLLEYIHVIIYERKRASEVRLQMWLQNKD